MAHLQRRRHNVRRVCLLQGFCGMSDLTQPKQGGRRRPQIFTERDVRRVLRAAKAEQENRTIRINRDGSIELVPVISEPADALTTDGKDDWDNI